MYALSKPRKAAFIYDPRNGLDIPLIVEFEHKAIFVEYPEVDDLEADFIGYPDLESLRNAAIGNKQDIDQVVRVGQLYSRKFADLIRKDDCSFDEITRLIIEAEKDQTPASGRQARPVFVTESYEAFRSDDVTMPVAGL